jgi:uncharacterized membrane protein YqgA involved in biofilm formation
MTGTLINIAAVIVGSSVGLIARSKLPERITGIVFQGIGLFTLLFGVSMAIKTGNFLLMIFSIVIGSIVGEWIDIERHVFRLGDSLKGAIRSKNEKFSEGLTAAFLLFCMGSMTILGAIEEGLGGEPNLLLAKSVLDGFASIGLAAALGIGVMFSVIPLLVYQGGITLFASYLQGVFTDAIISEMTATGGLLLIGLGVNILEIKRLRILNMLPALVIVVILSYFFA